MGSGVVGRVDECVFACVGGRGLAGRMHVARAWRAAPPRCGWIGRAPRRGRGVGCARACSSASAQVHWKQRRADEPPCRAVPLGLHAGKHAVRGRRRARSVGWGGRGRRRGVGSVVGRVVCVLACAWAGLGICVRAALRNALRACLTGRGHPLLRRVMSDNAIESVPAGVFDEIAGLQSMCECVRVAWHAAPRAARGKGGGGDGCICAGDARAARAPPRAPPLAPSLPRAFLAPTDQSPRMDTTQRRDLSRNRIESLPLGTIDFDRLTSLTSLCVCASRGAERLGMGGRVEDARASRDDGPRAPTHGVQRTPCADRLHPPHALARAEKSLGTRSRVRSRRRARSAPASPAASSPRIACPAG